jgi:bacterioferritin (cytochrome b1)
LKKDKIEFREITVPLPVGNKSVNTLYYVVDNGRSDVIENLSKLDKTALSITKRLFAHMMIYDECKSKKVQYRLRKHAYGEIKPMPHRFFFFRKFRNHIIFFDYRNKKKGSLGEKVYSLIEEKMKKYEEAFERYRKESK